MKMHVSMVITCFFSFVCVYAVLLYSLFIFLILLFLFYCCYFASTSPHHNEYINEYNAHTTFAAILITISLTIVSFSCWMVFFYNIRFQSIQWIFTCAQHRSFVYLLSVRLECRNFISFFIVFHMNDMEMFCFMFTFIKHFIIIGISSNFWKWERKSILV